MGHPHASTPEERVRWISHMLAHDGEYGMVTALSEQSGVSRQTLYTWAAQGPAALVAALTPAAPAPALCPQLERAILTHFVEGHTSYGVPRPNRRFF